MHLPSILLATQRCPLWRFSLAYCKTVALVGLLLSALPLRAQDDNKVLLWKLQASRGVEDSDLNLITGYISTEIQNQKNLSVYTQADIATLIETEELKQKCGVDDASCIAEIGNALGARQAVAGEIGKLGESWLVNLRRIDVQQVVVLKRVSKKIPGEFSQVIELMPFAVAELFTQGVEQVNDEHARLEFHSSPEGRGLVLDGKPAGITPLTVDVAPGPHRGAFFSDKSHKSVLAVAGSTQVYDASFNLQGQESSSGSSLFAHALLWPGLVSVAGATGAFFLLAEPARQAYENGEWSKQAEANGWRIGSFAAGGAGLVAAVAGTALLFVFSGDE